MKKKLEWRAGAGSLGCALASALGALGFAGAASATYVITDLGGQDFFFNGGGTGLHTKSLQYRLALNNKNEVVGTGMGTAYFWANGALQKLTGFAVGQADVTATDINDSGLIVGGCVGPARSANCGTGADSSYAIGRDGSTGQWIALQNVGGTGFVGNTESAYGVNAASTAVGVSTDLNPNTVPTTFGAPSTKIGPYDGFGGQAWAINDNNAIVTSNVFGTFAVRFNAPGDTSSDKQLLTPVQNISIAADINNANVTVGSSDLIVNGTRTFHAARWDANAAYSDLGTLFDDYSSYATAINESGVAVGQSGSVAFPNSENTLQSSSEPGKSST
jgi:hypothetical protein